MNVTIERVGARLVVRAPYDEKLNDVCAALPGAIWDRSHRVRTVPATLGSAVAAWNVLRKHAEVAASDDVHEILDRARVAAEARKYRTMELDELPAIESGSEHDPWIQQARAFHFAYAQEGSLLAMVMGAGKSRVVVDLVNAWQAKYTLIVCPKNVMRVWPREFRKHSLRHHHVTDGRPSKRNGEPKKTASLAERVDELDTLYAHADEPLVVVVNYETIWREPMREWLLEREWNVGVLDECHRAQAAGGKASKTLGRLRDKCERRIGGTGTIGDTGLAVYGYMRFIEPGLFGTSASAFRARYGKPVVKYVEQDVDAEGELISTPVYLTAGDNGPPVYNGLNDEARADFVEKLARVTYECGDEVIDLEAAVDHVIPVELGTKAQRIYRDLETMLVAEVNDADSDTRGVVMIDNALTKLLRLQQVTSGHVPVEPLPFDADVPDLDALFAADSVRVGQAVLNGMKPVVEHIDSAKESALADWLADVPKHAPVVVFAEFVHDLEAIKRVAEKVGRKYGELSGRRDTVLDDEACMLPHVELAAVQIRAGGVGVDLTRARYGVYYSKTARLVPYEQSRARLWRPGQQVEHPVEFVHLVAEGTVDEDITDGLIAKKEGVEHVLKALRKRFEQ